jgi:WD40 repeat protein
VTFSPDGQRIAVGTLDGFVAVYPLQTGGADTPQAQKLHAGRITSVAWDPSGNQVLSASGDGAVRMWDARTLQPSLRFNAVNATYPAAVWSPDGKRVAVATGRDSIQIYELGTAADPQTLKLPGSTRALLWLPNGDIAGSDLNGRVAFFQPGKSDPIRVYQPAASHKAVNSMALTPDGQLLAVGYDDGTIILVDPSTAKEVRQIGQSHSVGNVAWSPNGKVLAVSSIGFNVTFLDPAGKQLAGVDVGYDMNGVSWSPDGRLVAAASDDQTFKVWEVSPPQSGPNPTGPTPPTYMGR